MEYTISTLEPSEFNVDVVFLRCFTKFNFVGAGSKPDLYGIEFNVLRNNDVNC